MTQEGGTPPDFWARVEQVAERAVAKYARSGALRNSRISGGNGLTIADGGKLKVMFPEERGGDVSFYIGDIHEVGSGNYQGTGVLIQDTDTSDIAVFRSSTTGHPLVQIRDGGERVVFATNDVTGEGLARPFLPGGGFARARYGDWTVSTTSSSFETLWRAEMYKQHSKLTVATLSSMDTSGATGEIRVVVNGSPIGSPQSIGFALTTSLFGPDDAPGSHEDLLSVEIQGRRTSATGALRVEPLHLISRP